MAARSAQRRDADAASLAEIGVILGQFKRRAYDAAKTANVPLDDVSDAAVAFGYGTKRGRLAALEALKAYLPMLDEDIERARLALEQETGR